VEERAVRSRLLVLVSVLAIGHAPGASAHTGHVMWSSSSVFGPDGPLFTLQRVLDAWEELIAFDAVAKARVQAKIADNRLAEAEAMLLRRNDDLSRSLVDEAAAWRGKAQGVLGRATDEIGREKDEARARARRESIGALLVRLALNAQHAETCCARGALQ
jgi:hypothetical protein